MATCPNFLNDSAVNEAVEDITKVESKAWKTDTTHNIYLDLGDSDFPSDHIRNKLLPTTVCIWQLQIVIRNAHHATTVSKANAFTIIREGLQFLQSVHTNSFLEFKFFWKTREISNGW